MTIDQPTPVMQFEAAQPVPQPPPPPPPAAAPIVSAHCFNSYSLQNHTFDLSIFLPQQSTPVRRPRMANTSPSGGPAVRPNISIVLPATLAQSDQPNVFIITDPSQTEGVLQVSLNHLLCQMYPFNAEKFCYLLFFSKSRSNSTLRLSNL